MKKENGLVVVEMMTLCIMGKVQYIRVLVGMARADVKERMAVKVRRQCRKNMIA